MARLLHQHNTTEMKDTHELNALLARSEERLDKTGAMIADLTKTVKMVSATCAEQVKKLQAQRDLLQEQNAKLLQTCEELRKDLHQVASAWTMSAERESKMLAIIEKLTSNSVGVSIGNINK